MSRARGIVEALCEAVNVVRGRRVDDGVYAYTMTTSRGGKLKFESDGRSFWIMDIHVSKPLRRQGIATELMTELYRMASKARGHVIHGTRSDAGKHLLPMTRRVRTRFPKTTFTDEDETLSQ